VTAVAPAVATGAAQAAPAPSASGGASASKMDDPFPENPADKFSDGQRSFERVREAISKQYYLTGITDDEIYRAAVQGVLEHVDPKMRKWNKLISPAELAEIRSDLKGEIVGVGVRIHFDPASGHIEVQGVQPGSPAEKAGVTGGDLIVSVNGKRYKGMGMHDVVADIRGKIGEPVTLSVLREDKLLPFTLKREVVVFEEVAHQTFADGAVGYVQIHGFSSKTPAMLKAAMDDLASKQPKSLVVDLRLNQGGSFEDAVSAAEQFLPAGAGVVNVKKRDGKDETIASKGSPSMANLPMIVLVSHQTSSGAEFVTAALQEGRHARVVGARTFGKWSVQVIDDLTNGYAFKFTTGQFFSPSGKTFDGVGLTPDVEVDMADEQLEKVWLINDAEKRIAADSQLRTAVSILTTR
jgi:carboxyl-terminal processing protease